MDTDSNGVKAAWWPRRYTRIRWGEVADEPGNLDANFANFREAEPKPFRGK
jgi:hypothetical protein